MKTTNEHDYCNYRKSHTKATVNRVKSAILRSWNAQSTLLLIHSQSASIVQKDECYQAEHYHDSSQRKPNAKNRKEPESEPVSNRGQNGNTSHDKKPSIILRYD
jgi:hypothetical protein